MYPTGRERLDSAVPGQNLRPKRPTRYEQEEPAASETDEDCSGNSRMGRTRRTGTGGGEAATGIRNACCCFPFLAAVRVQFVGQNLERGGGEPGGIQCVCMPVASPSFSNFMHGIAPCLCFRQHSTGPHLHGQLAWLPQAVEHLSSAAQVPGRPPTYPASSSTWLVPSGGTQAGQA